MEVSSRKKKDLASRTSRWLCSLDTKFIVNLFWNKTKLCIDESVKNMYMYKSSIKHKLCMNSSKVWKHVMYVILCLNTSSAEKNKDNV